MSFVAGPEPTPGGPDGPLAELDPLVLARGGADWVEALRPTLTGVAAAWGITIGRPLRGGTSSYVTHAVTPSGQPAVLKICVPDVDFAGQVRTLAAADGRGYVRLLAADAGSRAMLLEPLGISLDRSGLSPARQLDVLARLLPLAWQVPDPGGQPLNKADQLIALITGLHVGGHRRVVEHALRYAERRSAAFDADRAVVVHGDAAAANVLQRNPDEWVFVDPDGFVGDPAYDLGVAARDWTGELLAAADPQALMHSYCRALGGDPDVTWEWAFVERVSTGLFMQSFGGDGSAHLASAAALLDR